MRLHACYRYTALSMRESYRLSAIIVQCSILNSSYCSCLLDYAVYFALAIHRTLALIIDYLQNNLARGDLGLGSWHNMGLALWHDKS